MRIECNHFSLDHRCSFIKRDGYEIFDRACTALTRNGWGFDVANEVLVNFQTQGYQGYILT